MVTKRHDEERSDEQRWKERYVAVQQAVSTIAKDALASGDPKIYEQALRVLADSGDLATLLLDNN